VPKSNTDVKEFEAEIRALTALDHPHIVKVVEYFEDKEDFYIVQEFCSGQDVCEYLMQAADKSGRGVPQQDASIILRQCLKAVIGCHSRGFVHRDLKPDNFMIDGTDRTVKLIDFGFASRLQSQAEADEVVGTPDYLPPEMVHHKGHYSGAVDIWSLGVVFWMLLTNEMLLDFELDSVQKWRDKLKDGSYIKSRLSSTTLAHASPDARDLLQKMLEVNPSNRISAKEALTHPFIEAHWGEDLDGAKHSNLKWDFDRGIIDKMRRFVAAPVIKKMALLCLAHIAPASESVGGAELSERLLVGRHLFRTVDADGDGTVTLAELTRVLRQENIDIPADLPELLDLCSGMGSGSGSVHFCDVMACLLIDTHCPEALIHEVFRSIDANDSGVIDIGDLQQLFAGTGLSYQDGIASIQELDHAGKGTLTYHDFCTLMRPCSKSWWEVFKR